ncbi:MAG: hypothetical protein ACREUL_19215 [Steroidobacteraceae bacterium]
MDPRLVTPYLIAVLVAWVLYRRMRRSFGRQRVQDRRMWVRIGFFILVTILVAGAVARDTRVLVALGAGIVCGVVLGYVGLKYTKFEITSEGRFYTPHAYIGLVVFALLVGRLLYKFLGVYNGVVPAAAAGQSLAATYQHSPFLVAVLGALVGYYVLYYLGVLQRTRRPTALGPGTGATGGLQGN